MFRNTDRRRRKVYQSWSAIESCGKLCSLCGNTCQRIIKMGLTGPQKGAIVSSWKTLTADMKTIQENGSQLFALLFQQFPDTRGYFPWFSGMSDESMKSSGVGRAHAMAVFNGIGAFVSSLEDQECLDGLALKLCRNHLDRKIGSSRFQQMRQVYGSFLDGALGGGATADVKAAWDAFLSWLQDFLAAEEKKR
ncbi:globin-like [Littorina saxatilis]|uniref:Globin n=1 Tax=Littorina saxatilis TaxID=31220 RepID=A0AAN9B9Q1_9CAEN